MTTNADLRMAEALGISPDLRDRDAIARARFVCASEATHNRRTLERLASTVQLDTMGDLKDATMRLEKLLVRIETLDAMAKAALQAEVDADPTFAGGTVEPDGAISGVSPMTVVSRLLWPGSDGEG